MNESRREWSIQEVARITGTTSRALHHYGDVGILPPSRIGANGYRYYDEGALQTLQRILLLRELGLGIPAIAGVLAGQADHGSALLSHLHWLQDEKSRLDRQIASVETTIQKLKEGTQLMAQEMFDGFDHTQYSAEVEQRWGRETAQKSDSWWAGQSTEQKSDWMSQHTQLAADWAAAARAGSAPGSTEAQDLAARHVAWLSRVPGIPRTADERPAKHYVLGLGEMYVADERFAANYGGTEGAGYVRDALRVYAEQNL